MRRLPIALSLLVGLAPALTAQDLSLPEGAVQTSAVAVPMDTYDLPIGPWDGAAVPAQPLEGAVSQSAWQVPGATTTLALLAPLRQQLLDAGAEVLFECRTETCGGFDFRFTIRTLPAPDMLVSLNDYRFLSARLDEAWVSLLVSKTESTGYVQITRVDVGQTTTVSVAPVSVTTAPAAQSADLIGLLTSEGHAVLEDVTFASGAAELGDAPIPSLAALTDYLAAHPTLKIALVGHTDSAGSLDANIAVSKRRAAAVRERLISAHAADGARIAAEGMGYLAPRASNLTQAGREANRRVEVVLLSE